ANTRQVRPDYDIAGEPARLGCLAVVCFRQWAARHLEWTLHRGPYRRTHVREHEMLRSDPLCHGAEITRRALAIEDRWWHSAIPIRAHDRMDRRMDDDVNTPCQSLNLIGRRSGARWSKHIVACIAPNHYAASGRVHSVGRMAWNMRRSNCAHLDIAGGPDHVRFLLRLERDDIDQLRRTSRKTRLVLSVALSDLARLEERVANMLNKLRAAYRKPERRCYIRAANRVELWPLGIEMPTQLNDVGKAFRVVRMHMRKEDRIELSGRHAYLRQPHVGPASGIELHPEGTAIV